MQNATTAPASRPYLRSSPHAVLFAVALAVLSATPGFARATPAATSPATATAPAVQPPVTPAEAQALIESDSPPQVLDVRTAAEFAEGHVPGATLIPHDELAGRLDELDRDRPVLVYCRSGRRSTLAEKELLAAGFDVRQIDGSWLRWQEEKRPVETPSKETK
jgi:phage shock protein E